MLSQMQTEIGSKMGMSNEKARGRDMIEREEGNHCGMKMEKERVCLEKF